jgi:hypothetical protein
VNIWLANADHITPLEPNEVKIYKPGLFNTGPMIGNLSLATHLMPTKAPTGFNSEFTSC